MKIGDEPTPPFLEERDTTEKTKTTFIQNRGMTVRKQYVMAAMQGLIHVNSRIYPNDLAKDAVKLADACLAEEEKTNRCEENLYIYGNNGCFLCCVFD